MPPGSCLRTFSATSSSALAIAGACAPSLQSSVSMETEVVRRASLAVDDQRLPAAAAAADPDDGWAARGRARAARLVSHARARQGEDEGATNAGGFHHGDQQRFVVWFVHGEAAAHATGRGGMSGGGSFVATGVSFARAAWSNVSFVSVTGSQPPPFQ